MPNNADALAEPRGAVAMTRRLAAYERERGASLVLAIAFMVVIGAIAMATLAMITSGLNNRRTLDEVRDREYGADAAIEFAIANVRTLDSPNGGPALQNCADGAARAPYTVDGHSYHVDCQNAPAVTFGGLLQRNVIFTACEGTTTCAPRTRSSGHR